MRGSAVQRRVLGLLIAGVLLVILQQLGALKPLVSITSVLTKPFQGVFSNIGSSVGGWFDVLGSIGTLASENQHLKQQVAGLQQQVASTTELKAQNETLKQQLGVGEVQANRLIAAQVIGYQPDNFRQYITISRGSRDGIVVGMAVVIQGALIGTIQEVGPTTSKVFLVTDSNFKVAALDQDQPTRPVGTLHGQIGGGLAMDNIAQNETVKQGDMIVTSGLGGQIEKGLILGRIQTVTKEDNGVFQAAQITSTVQFNRLEVVYVVVRPE